MSPPRDVTDDFLDKAFALDAAYPYEPPVPEDGPDDAEYEAADNPE